MVYQCISLMIVYDATRCLDERCAPTSMTRSSCSPPSLREGLPADHLTSFVADLVADLDLTPVLTTYGGVTRGTVPS